MKPKTVLLYILFFLAAVFIFLFVCFPKKPVAEYLSQTLTKPNSSIQFSVERVRPGLPFKFCFENSKMVIDNTIKIVPDTFDVFLGPSFLFSAERPLKFQSNIYEGVINGRLIMDNFNPFSFSGAKLTLSNVTINNFTYKTALADIDLNCELNGDHQYTNTNDTKNTKHLGKGTILIQNFSAEMKASLFNRLNLPIVDFSTIKLEYTQLLKTITIKQCIAKGSIINVNLKGKINIIHPLQESRLDFTGLILPDSPYLANFANIAHIKARAKNISKDGLKFKLNGTLKNPKIDI